MSERRAWFKYEAKNIALLIMQEPKGFFRPSHMAVNLDS